MVDRGGGGGGEGFNESMGRYKLKVTVSTVYNDGLEPLLKKRIVQRAIHCYPVKNLIDVSLGQPLLLWRILDAVNLLNTRVMFIFFSS